MSFYPCNNFSRTTTCSICCEDFKKSRKVLAHRDPSGRAIPAPFKRNGYIHPIHANCLQNLLKASVENANTPPKCPLCRDQITHINGKPIQHVQRQMLPAPLDPLSADAINENEVVSELEYRVSENRRLLSQRVFQSLIPGRVEGLGRRIENLARLQLIPEDYLFGDGPSLCMSAVHSTLMDRNMVYATTITFSILIGGLCISMHSFPDDPFKSLFLGTMAAICGSLAARSLRNLQQTVQIWGTFLF